MTQGLIAGVAVGLLIGVITGTVALVLLKAASTASPKDVKSIVQLTGEMLAIAGFWVGGTWASRGLSNLLPWASGMMNPYLCSLAITFTGVVSYPVFRWVVHLGEELGRGEGEKSA